MLEYFQLAIRIIAGFVLSLILTGIVLLGLMLHAHGLRIPGAESALFFLGVIVVIGVLVVGSVLAMQGIDRLRNRQRNGE